MNINIVTKEEFQALSNKIEKVLDLLVKNKPTIESEWLKSSEVKRILKCSDASLKNYRDNEVFPCTRIGGTFYYAKKDVENMLSNQK